MSRIATMGSTGSWMTRGMWVFIRFRELLAALPSTRSTHLSSIIGKKTYHLIPLLVEVGLKVAMED
jgi:hypothetical protein